MEIENLKRVFDNFDVDRVWVDSKGEVFLTEQKNTTVVLRSEVEEKLTKTKKTKTA